MHGCKPVAFEIVVVRDAIHCERVHFNYQIEIKLIKLEFVEILFVSHLQYV